jgi:hypothetical protein
MDYQLEAFNSMTFQKQMASLQGIVVATVYPELTSNKVRKDPWSARGTALSISWEDILIDLRPVRHAWPMIS